MQIEIHPDAEIELLSPPFSYQKVFFTFHFALLFLS